jgi:hypothetical protein
MTSIDSATREMINAVSVTNSPKRSCGPVRAKGLIPKVLEKERSRRLLVLGGEITPNRAAGASPQPKEVP